MISSKNIKKLFLTIIIFLIPLSYSLADTIEDFEIEGVSIGESLLDYATEDEIKSIKLIGCGTAFHSCLVGKYWFEQLQI